MQSNIHRGKCTYRRYTNCFKYIYIARSGSKSCTLLALRSCSCSLCLPFVPLPTSILFLLLTSETKLAFCELYINVIREYVYLGSLTQQQIWKIQPLLYSLSPLYTLPSYNYRVPPLSTQLLMGIFLFSCLGLILIVLL